MIPRSVYTVTLNATGVSATTGYVLVDKSDTTNFPHSATGELHLLSLLLTGEKASDGDYNILVGVVVENDATDGSADGIHDINLSAINNPTDSTDRFSLWADFTLGGAVQEGINCQVDSGALTRILSNISDADNTAWQNDTGLASPAGAAGGSTGKPGVGDIVVLVTENSGTGTIDFCLTAQYSAA